tara:strand:+ start:1713 stop:2633 length:921 start_codon:yes stop_codon:yes gene_type:complete
MKKPYLILILVFLSTQLVSQYQINLIPRSSPDKGIYHKIGYTEIDIEYGSPKVNERALWGEMIPYDEIWRAGANVATTMTFSEDITIEGKILPKGRYAFFVIPRKNGPWTVIFSSKPDQWGAFGHKTEEEVMRLEIEAVKSYYSEELSYRVEQKDFDNGVLVMDWENIRLNIPFSTQYLDLLINELDEHLNKSSEHLKWVLYLQAGEYLFNQKKRTDLALEWINESEKLSIVEGNWDKRYYPKDYILGHLYWTKAKLLAHDAMYEKAVDYALLMKGQKGKYNFYEEENEYESIDAQIENWAIKAER